ncbi:hypothetical protein [Thermococcus sp. Bubb.Bath]|uniref:hypothetical protein n=1 Tax=Thermococcus sp. Bubb.Bath TaxID=1638242 RepID=UPI00143AB871|nr:hypothetical protein [Thermococcus sp. Bubb.Bath]NJF24889.1 hypothetical protein [Thermococcus sp. Bubb.Bath]
MKPETGINPPEIAAGYPSLISLAAEILKGKVEEACTTRTDSRPFIRVNQKTRKLELVMPVTSLSKLEKCVLESMGFPKKPVRTRNGMVIAIVISQPELERVGGKLSERLRARYSKSSC